MSLQHIQKNSPRLLPKPAKFEKNPPNGYRVIRKTKCGAAGAGGAGSSPIHKQASLAGRLITIKFFKSRLHNCIYAINRQTNTRNYTNFKSNLAMMVIYVPVKFEFDWTKRFPVRVQNRNVDGQTNGEKTDKRTDAITPIFESNLGMMVFYLPVKFEFDWTTCFGVRVFKQKC